MSDVNVFWVGQYQRGNTGFSYHKHEFYQMVIPLSGALSVNEDVTIKRKEIMLTKPGQYHAFTSADPNGYCNLFDCKFSVTDPELHAQLVQMPHCFSVQSDSLIYGLVQTILTEAKYKEPFYQKSIDYHFGSILLTLVRQFSSSTEKFSQYHEEITDDAQGGFIKGFDAMHLRTYIDANIDRISSLDDLTTYVHSNKSTLIDAFKHIFGLTPMRYVNHRRMEIAKELLLDSNLSISEIARKVGFQSIFYFSKSFKDREGISPLAFRDQGKNNYFLLPHSTEFDMDSGTSYRLNNEKTPR